MKHWIQRAVTGLVGAFAVLGLLLLWGQVDSLQAQVRGLSEAQVVGRARTYTAAQTFTTATITALAGTVLPNADGTLDIGSPQKRFDEIDAKEGRFFCPGGPVSSAGSTICFDPDDPFGGAWKLLVGGQTLYVQVSDVHP